MPSASDSSSKPVVVMCIEDNHDTLDFVRLTLRPTGYALITVSNPMEGLQLARRDPPDLLLLDLMMPDLSGWEIIRQLRRDEATRGIPIVIMTARGGKVDRHYGEQVVKVEAYLTKPFDPKTLRETIRNVLIRSGRLARADGA